MAANLHKDLMDLRPSAGTSKRFQFSLRSLLTVLTLCAFVALGISLDGTAGCPLTLAATSVMFLVWLGSGA